MQFPRSFSLSLALAFSATTLSAQRVESVTFCCSRDVVMETPAFGQTYPNQNQWKDFNADGDAADHGEYRVPIAYYSGDFVVIDEVVFQEVPILPPGSTIDVYGYGMDNQEFFGTGTQTGTEVRSDLMTATLPLPSTVRFYNMYEIDWWLTYHLPNGSDITVYVGPTFNRMYVTLGDVPSSVPFYESLAELSCEAADGLTDPTMITEAIFAKMATRDVQRKPMNGFNHPDGAPLHYWQQNFGSGPGGFTTQYLMLHKDGRCGAWSEFFWACVKLQNGAGSRTSIQPRPNTDDEVLLVRNWDINNPGGSSGVPRYPFVVGTDVVDGDGIPAQNMAEPATQVFNDHCVYRVGADVFDPSYGVHLSNSIAYENTAFFGYGMRPRFAREDLLIAEDCQWTDF